MECGVSVSILARTVGRLRNSYQVPGEQLLRVGHFVKTRTDVEVLITAPLVWSVPSGTGSLSVWVFVSVSFLPSSENTKRLGPTRVPLLTVSPEPFRCPPVTEIFNVWLTMVSPS